MNQAKLAPLILEPDWLFTLYLQYLREERFVLIIMSKGFSSSWLKGIEWQLMVVGGCREGYSHYGRSEGECGEGCSHQSRQKESVEEAVHTKADRRVWRRLFIPRQIGRTV